VSENGEGATFGYLIAAVIVIWFGGKYLHNTVWGEREGVINTDDCRSKVAVVEGSSATWFRKFTCVYQKDRDGSLMRGACEAVDITPSGACETDYYYEKKASPSICPESAPYLGLDGKCTPQSHDKP
jgi:hypothetical protein